MLQPTYPCIFIVEVHSTALYRASSLPLEVWRTPVHRLTCLVSACVILTLYAITPNLEKAYRLHLGYLYDII